MASFSPFSLGLVLSPQDNSTDLQDGPFPISQSSLETPLQTHVQVCPLSHLDNSKARQVNNEGNHQKLSPRYLSITKGLPSPSLSKGVGSVMTRSQILLMFVTSG